MHLFLVTRYTYLPTKILRFCAHWLSTYNYVLVYYLFFFLFSFISFSFIRLFCPLAEGNKIYVIHTYHCSSLCVYVTSLACVNFQAYLFLFRITSTFTSLFLCFSSAPSGWKLYLLIWFSHSFIPLFQSSIIHSSILSCIHLFIHTQSIIYRYQSITFTNIHGLSSLTQPFIYTYGYSSFIHPLPSILFPIISTSCSTCTIAVQNLISQSTLLPNSSKGTVHLILQGLGKWNPEIVWSGFL